MDDKKNELVNFPDNRRHSVREYYDHPGEDDFDEEYDESMDDEYIGENETEGVDGEDYNIFDESDQNNLFEENGNNYEENNKPNNHRKNNRLNKNDQTKSNNKMNKNQPKSNNKMNKNQPKTKTAQQNGNSSSLQSKNTIGKGASSPTKNAPLTSAKNASTTSAASGTTAGTASGATAGTASGATAGAASGATAGAASGATAGAASGATAGAASGATAGAAATGWGLLVIVIIVVILVILFVLAVVLIYLYGFEEINFPSQNYGITGAKCDYNTNGIDSDTLVELINCDATKHNYTVLDTVPLEKYIAGVALVEIGEDTLNNEEALKAQIVATRSYTLTRNIPEYNVGYDSAKNVIRMRACENDQVYWDYTKDLYRSGGGIAKYSPYEYTPAEGEEPFKHALTEEQIQKYESIYQSVLGKYAADVNGDVVYTPYHSNFETKDGETDKFRSLAAENKGNPNGNYDAILLNVYNENHDYPVSQIKDTECSIPVYNSVGEYSTWKQNASLGAPWAEVKIGTTATIDSAGCLITSIAMQIAHSGIPTGNITDFNPGTFATALKNNDILSDRGAINSYSNINKVIPGFTYAGGNDWTKYNTAISKRYERIKKVTEDGYYTVIEVKKHRGGQHWVALDVQNSANANWEEIYIWDPASTKTTISDADRYQVNRIVYFKLENGG